MYYHGQKHKLNPTWNLLQLGFPKFQLKHNIDTTYPQALLKRYFVYYLASFSSIRCLVGV